MSNVKSDKAGVHGFHEFTGEEAENLGRFNFARDNLTAAIDNQQAQLHTANALVDNMPGLIAANIAEALTRGDRVREPGVDIWQFWKQTFGRDSHGKPPPPEPGEDIFTVDGFETGGNAGAVATGAALTAGTLSSLSPWVKRGVSKAASYAVEHGWKPVARWAAANARNVLPAVKSFAKGPGLAAYATAEVGGLATYDVAEALRISDVRATSRNVAGATKYFDSNLKYMPLAVRFRLNEEYSKDLDNINHQKDVEDRARIFKKTYKKYQDAERNVAEMRSRLPKGDKDRISRYDQALQDHKDRRLSLLASLAKEHPDVANAVLDDYIYGKYDSTAQSSGTGNAPGYADKREQYRQDILGKLTRFGERTNGGGRNAEEQMDRDTASVFDGLSFDAPPARAPGALGTRPETMTAAGLKLY